MDDLELDLSYEAIANSTPLHVPLSILQGPENRIPGPAGRPAIVPGSASAGRGGGGAGGNFTQGGTPIEFVGNEWQTALRMLGISDFNGTPNFGSIQPKIKDSIFSLFLLHTNRKRP